jgi:hypothetical protein
MAADILCTLIFCVPLIASARALFLGHATWNAVRYTLEQEMPKYYVEKLKVSTAVAGFHMGSLHVVSFVLLVLSKDLVDSLIVSGSLTTLRLRQLSISGGYSIVAGGAISLSCLAACQAGDVSGLIGSVASLSPPGPVAYTVALHVIWTGLTFQTFGESLLSVARIYGALLYGSFWYDHPASHVPLVPRRRPHRQLLRLDCRTHWRANGGRQHHCNDSELHRTSSVRTRTGHLWRSRLGIYLQWDGRHCNDCCTCVREHGSSGPRGRTAGPKTGMNNSRGASHALA